MGLVKNAMIEAESLTWGETEVTFTCPECKKKSDGMSEIPRTDPRFQSDIDTDLEIECIWCEAEYQASIVLAPHEQTITLNDHPDTEVKFEPVCFEAFDEYDWEDEYYFERPRHPYEVFERAHGEIVDFCRKSATESGYDFVNRMAFMQSFSAFEAYLSDAFLNLVFLDEKRRAQCLNLHKDLNSIKFSISDLVASKGISTDEFINKAITQTIKETLFHNLDKASKLFQMYGIDIFVSEDARNRLFEAVERRHHCVHRNGNDLEGEPLDIFTQSYCLDTVNIMLACAKKIDEEITGLAFDD